MASSFNYESCLAKDRHEQTLRDLVQILGEVQLHVPEVPAVPAVAAADGQPAVPGVDAIPAREESILERLGVANVSENIRRLREPERGVIQRSNFEFQFEDVGDQRNIEAILARLTTYNENAPPAQRMTLNQIVYKIGVGYQMFNEGFDEPRDDPAHVNQRWVRIQERRTMDQFFSEASNVIWLDIDQTIVDYALTMNYIQDMVRTHRFNQMETGDVLLRLVNKFMPENNTTLREWRENPNMIARFLIDSQNSIDKKEYYIKKIQKLRRKKDEPIRKVITELECWARLIYDDENEPLPLRQDKIKRIAIKGLVCFTTEPLSSQLMSYFQGAYKRQEEVDLEHHLRMIETQEASNNFYPKNDIVFGEKLKMSSLANIQPAFSNIKFNSINVKDFYAINKRDQTLDEKQSIKQYLDHRDREEAFFQEMSTGFDSQYTHLGGAIELDENGDEIEVDDMEPGLPPIFDQGAAEVMNIAAAAPVPNIPNIPVNVLVGGDAGGAVGGAGEGTPGAGQGRGKANNIQTQPGNQKSIDYLPTVKDNPAHVIAGEDWKKFACYPEHTAMRLLAERANMVFQPNDPNRLKWTQDYYDQYREMKQHWKMGNIDNPDDVRIEDALSSTLIFNESEIIDKDSIERYKEDASKLLLPINPKKRTAEDEIKLLQALSQQGNFQLPKRTGGNNVEMNNSYYESLDDRIKRCLKEYFEGQIPRSTSRGRSKKRRKDSESGSKSRSRSRSKSSSSKTVKNYSIKNYYAGGENSEMKKEGIAGEVGSKKKTKKKEPKFIRSSSGKFYEISSRENSRSPSRNNNRNRSNSKGWNNSNNRSNSNSRGNNNQSGRGRSKSPLKCYTCQQIGHIASECKNHQNVRCYRCQQVGHISPNCPQKI